MGRFKDLIKGFTDTVPVGISVSLYGIVYGVMAFKAGISIFTVIAMSVFVFAGASQMAAVNMIAQGSSAIAIVLTVFIINLRHFLMAASISGKLQKVPNRFKLINAFFMTDESFAVSYNHFLHNKPTGMYFLGSGLNIYLFWGGAGVLGYFFGDFIPAGLNNVLDFTFVAAFIGILVPMIKDLPVVFTVAVSVVLSVLGSVYIDGKLYILIAAVGASFAGYIASSISESKGGLCAGEEEEVA